MNQNLVDQFSELLTEGYYISGSEVVQIEFALSIPAETLLCEVVIDVFYEDKGAAFASIPPYSAFQKRETHGRLHNRPWYGTIRLTATANGVAATAQRGLDAAAVHASSPVT